MSSYQEATSSQFAIRMEENGEKFYNYAASIAKDPKIYGIFTKLAAEEVKHRKLFADMFSRIDTVMPKESYPGEYMAYLQASVDGKVFTAEASKDLADVRDVAAALDFAIGDSIPYSTIWKHQEVRHGLRPEPARPGHRGGAQARRRSLGDQEKPLEAPAEVPVKPHAGGMPSRFVITGGSGTTDEGRYHEGAIVSRMNAGMAVHPENPGPRGKE